MADRRVYLITEGHDTNPKRAFSGLKKLVAELSEDYDLPSYNAVMQRLYRAKKRTGQARIVVTSKDGNRKYTIEVKDIE